MAAVKKDTATDQSDEVAKVVGTPNNEVETAKGEDSKEVIQKDESEKDESEKDESEKDESEKDGSYITLAAITSLRGIIDIGNNCEPSDFKGGAAVIKDLLSRNLIKKA